MILAGMDQLLVFIHYNGQWNNAFTYKNFQVTGIQIPNNCTYQNLIKLVSTHLKIENEEKLLQINYQVKE